MSEKSWKFDNEAHQSKDAFKAKGKMWLWPALVGIAVDDGEMVSAVAHDLGWLFFCAETKVWPEAFPSSCENQPKEEGRGIEREIWERDRASNAQERAPVLEGMPRAFDHHPPFLLCFTPQSRAVSRSYSCEGSVWGGSSDLPLLPLFLTKAMECHRRTWVHQDMRSAAHWNRLGSS